MSASPTSGLDARLCALFGDDVDWRAATGLLHVLAIGASPRLPIAVGPGAPESATDRFVLGFARARAGLVAQYALVTRRVRMPSESACAIASSRTSPSSVGSPPAKITTRSGLRA